MLERLERQKARTDPRQRRLYLQLMRHTAETSIDGQGRITIPQHLAEFAGIDGEVVFVGAGDAIEMWEPGRYRDYLDGAEGDFEGWLAEFL